jgi:ATP-dependent protease ClpP protease subunit
VNYANIYITPNEKNPLGVIGEVPGERPGETIKGTELVDVMTQVAKFPEAQAFLFHCAGPGGDVNAGDQIYDFMEGLKAEGKVVDTITAGDIGSIMTKPFLAGQKRTIVEGHKLYVHAPWVPHLEGNAGQIIQGLQGLINDEQKLLDFYFQKTSLTKAGLKGLMDGASVDGTFLTAEQALSLKFATHKQPSKIKAYAQIKNNNMANETLGQKVDAVLAFLKGNKAAELPGGEAAPAGDPNTLPDGEYPLQDGRVLVVMGGQIKEIKAPAAAQAPVTAAASAEQVALQAKVDSQAQELAAMKEEQDKALKALSDFQASMVSGKAPAKAFNNNGQGAPETTTHKNIAMKQREKQEQHKQTRN